MIHSNEARRISDLNKQEARVMGKVLKVIVSIIKSVSKSINSEKRRREV